MKGERTMKAQRKDDDRSKEQAQAQLESIKEFVAALEAAGDDDAKREEAEQDIHNDPLSVEVRSNWYAPGANDADTRPGEYNILLCTGGPACRIVGDLSEHGEPETARIEHQDWGTFWTELRITGEEEDTVLTYARCFYFGE
jgi:hypothetical protein